MKRFIVSVWHGEGDTHYHIIDCDAPSGEQPAIVVTLRRSSGYTLARANEIAEETAIACK